MKKKAWTCFVLIVALSLICVPVLSWAVSEGDMAPDFSLSTLKGDSISLSSFKGNNNLIVIFWAVKGMYCKHELKNLEKKYDELKANDIEVLAINLKQKEERVKNFSDEQNFSFPILLDANGEVADSYEVTGLPVMLIIDKEGMIKWRGYRLPRSYLKFLK